jgi:VWFA-related protein
MDLTVVGDRLSFHSMRSWLLAFLISTGAAQTLPPPPVTRLVLALQKPDGKPASDISASDLQVEVDGRPSPIGELRSTGKLPKRIALVFDASGSSARRTRAKEIINGVLQLVDRELQPEADLVYGVIFDSEIYLDQDATNDLTKVMQALNRHASARGGTAMLDAISLSAAHLSKSDIVDGRRAILLFSDGEDNASQIRKEAAIRAAQQSNVLVFGFDIGGGDKDYYRKQALNLMREIAEGTGGDFCESPQTPEQLQSCFTHFTERLAAQYRLSLNPPIPRDGKKHLLTVRANSNLIVTAPVRLYTEKK